MKLKEWRILKQMTQRECAALLGIGHARNFQRYETGAIEIGSIMAEKIRQVTGGMVSLEDLHSQRLDWIKENNGSAMDGVIAPQAEARP